MSESKRPSTSDFGIGYPPDVARSILDFQRGKPATVTVGPKRRWFALPRRKGSLEVNGG